MFHYIYSLTREHMQLSDAVRIRIMATTGPWVETKKSLKELTFTADSWKNAIFLIE